MRIPQQFVSSSTVTATATVRHQTTFESSAQALPEALCAIQFTSTMKIPKIKLVPKPDDSEGKQAVGYKWNNTAGTRHFLGGIPDGLDITDYPKCDDCNQPMTFYAQIDSIGDDFDLADCQVIHNFVCFDCFTVKAQLTKTLAN